MTEKELTRLYESLRSRNRDVRGRALAAVSQLAPSERVALARLERARRGQGASRLARWNRWTSAGLILSAGLVMLTKQDIFLMLEAAFLLANAPVLTAQFGLSGRRPVRLVIAETLEHMHDIAAAPAALELLNMGYIRKSFTNHSAPAEAILRSVFRRLLPRIGPQDTEGWTEAQRYGLRAPLAEPKFDVELSLNCIRVLAFAGGPGDVFALRSLSKLRGDGDAARLRSAARDALPVLEARVAQSMQSARLLRPANSESAENLLRPALSRGEAQSEHLLRATVSQSTAE